MGDHSKSSLIMPFVPVGFWTCSYTLEEDVVVQCEGKNQSSWPEWHQSQSIFVVLCEGRNQSVVHGCSNREDPLAMGADVVQWPQRRGGTTLWEYDVLVVLGEESSFGGTGCSRSIETSYEEEVERILKATPLVVGAGTVELSGKKVKSMWGLCEGR